MFNRPKQADDRCWQRLQELAVDLEQCRSQVRSLSAEWADTLTRINKAIQRLERAQERADRKRQEPVESPLSLELTPGAPEAHGFAAKLAKINGSHSK